MFFASWVSAAQFCHAPLTIKIRLAAFLPTWVLLVHRHPPVFGDTLRSQMGGLFAGRSNVGID